MARAGHAVEGLTPGYFALVMATGILSVGMQLEGFDTLSAGLLVVCGSSFVVLLALTGWRLVAYRGSGDDDCTDGHLAFGVSLLCLRVGLLHKVVVAVDG